MLKNKNKYLRFLGNGILFFVIIFMFDQLLGNVLRHYYFQRKSGESYLSTYAMDSNQAEIIILGSSRANHHYVSQIFKDSLKMSCYNSGRDGCLILYNVAVFKSILKRYRPKIVIFDINPDEIFYTKDSYEKLNVLYPYYYDKPEVQKIINFKSNFEHFKFLSCLYPFNSTFIGSIFRQKIDMNERNLKGYIPLYGTTLSNTSIQKGNNVESSLDSNNIRELLDLAKICNNNGIRLIFIQSPRYTKLNQSFSIETLRKIASINNSEFWNYGNDSLFIIKPSLFKDAAHMNNEGAIMFSKTIIKRIKQN